MNNLFFSLLLLGFAPALSAQNTSVAVTETSTKHAYSLRIKLDKGRRADLVNCYNAAATDGVTLDATGDFAVETELTSFAINVRQRTLRIRNTDASAASVEAARALGDRVQECLQLNDTPAPPKPPTH